MLFFLSTGSKKVKNRCFSTKKVFFIYFKYTLYFFNIFILNIRLPPQLDYQKTMYTNILRRLLQTQQPPQNNIT